MELHGEDLVNTANGISYIDNTDRTETTPLQGSYNDTKGLKVIVSCFTIMTVIVSIALSAQMYYGDNNHFLHGSVVTDHHDCSAIGGKILRKGGNAVDAAIASTICMGVVHPHLTGIGGGGFMLVYDQRLRKLLDCIDFRPSKSVDISVGVPGFIAGLYSGHLKHGKLSWSEVVSYSVDLARNGYRITESLVSSVSFLKANSSHNEPLEKWLNSLKLGSIGLSKKLGDTLEALAKSGADGIKWWWF